MKQVHPISPIWDSRSEILILGSFPSVKSREICFFYGHPQNRFWKVLADVFGGDVPQTTAQKRDFLLSNRVAVWDVIQSCEITGSSDSSIRQVTPNDINILLRQAPIRKIFTNGTTAKKLYDRYLLPQTGKEAVLLPSTSPANASWSLSRLSERWKTCIKGELTKD